MADLPQSLSSRGHTIRGPQRKIAVKYAAANLGGGGRQHHLAGNLARCQCRCSGSSLQIHKLRVSKALGVVQNRDHGRGQAKYADALW